MKVERMKPNLLFIVLAIFCSPTLTLAQGDPARLPQVDSIPTQPTLAHVHRLTEAMEVLGVPFSKVEIAELEELKNTSDAFEIASQIQRILDPKCLLAVTIEKEGPPTITDLDEMHELVEQGWQTFLIKIINPHENTHRLLIESPNARPLPHAPADEVESRWMQISAFEGQPLKANLSGIPLEYRVIQIYSRDSGEKDAILEIAVSNKIGADGDLFREWRFDQGTDGWQGMNQIDVESQNGSLNITCLGEDPFMVADVEGRGGPMLLRFWAKTDVEGVGQFFWWTKDKPSADGQRQTVFLLHPGKEHLYEIPFDVEGRLAGIRIDPLVKPGAVRIDWIDLYSELRTANWGKSKMKFAARPSNKVTFEVLDAYGKPCFAKFLIKDEKGRVYPSQSKRLAPDFFFQQHVYRGYGESVSLPNGNYTIQCSRGPETHIETKAMKVKDAPATFFYRVKRWTDPAKRGYWSGDHHIHAAGCLHYNNPTQGVQPEDMIRHTMGEDLKVGCCLTWGPCFDFQKRFFTGDTSEKSVYPYLLRYDVEVSGFGSHVSGHLNLLNLKEQIYPGGVSKDHWPTLGLNTLKWAKSQGAVCGPAHSSAGLMRYVGRVDNTEGKDGKYNLPNYNVPAFDGIGANEFIMNVAHDVPGPDGKPVPAVDFISAMNTDRVAEWNMWYHVLNCGFRTRVSGETDFPCMSGERVGIGRVYAKVDGRLTFKKWVDSVATGRSYVSDARCHLFDLTASTNKELTDGGTNKVELGLNDSQLNLKAPGVVNFNLTANALFEDTPTAPKEVEVELIVNGMPVTRKTIRADGSLNDVRFATKIHESSWAAVRVFPHAHTNPIFVQVERKPIRASADSARWCIAGVKQCWKSKQHTYAKAELVEAELAYKHAENVFRKILNETRQPERN